MSLLEPGKSIARYTILGRLAEGGMSELYLARQAGPGGFHKILVLKVVLPHLAEDEKFVQMFENEAKLAALLNHPNVVQVYDFGAADAIHYLAMEYLDGLSLSAVRGRHGETPLPIPLACRISSDVAGALAYAHSLADGAGQPLQVIHRDVSLENILLTYAGQVKLVDFGLAKARTLVSATTQGTIRGKYRYMAPVMIAGKAFDYRIDIFALGVVLYTLLTGKMPFHGATHAELFRNIVSMPPLMPRQRNPSLPLELEQIVLRALEKEPRLRYQRAGELQAELEAYMARTTSVAPYQLAQFMAALFPPGTDDTRTTYQGLAGVVAPAAPVGALPGPHDAEPLADPTLPDRAATRVERPNAPAFSFAPTQIVARDATARRTGDDTLRDGRDRWLSEQPTNIEGPAAPGETATHELVAEETVAHETILAATVGDETSPARTAPVLLAAPSTSTVDGAPLHQAELDPSRTTALRRRWIIPLFAATAAAAVIAASVWLWLWPDDEAARPPAVTGPRGEASAPPVDSRGLESGSPRDARQLPDSATRPPGSAPAPDASRADVRLKSAKGRIVVHVWPYATVTLDGKLLGSTPLPPIPASEGTHLLVIENTQLRARKEVRVRVRAGQSTRVKLTLE